MVRLMRWWYCPECLAVNDGLEVSRCWNCDRVQRKIKKFPWCAMGTSKCEVCGRTYVTWTLAPEPEIALGFCPFYFEHYGDNAYTSPQLPSVFVLEVNGYRWDEVKKKLVKLRRKETQ
jgi:hypothetical protein